MSRIAEIVHLVHRRDALLAERARRTAELDLEIEEIERALASLGSSVAGQHAGKARRLLALLQRSPQPSYPELTEAIYGVDSSGNRKLLRSALDYLKNRGEIRSLGDRKWEVLKPLG